MLILVYYNLCIEKVHLISPQKFLCEKQLKFYLFSENLAFWLSSQISFTLQKFKLAAS